MSEVIDVVGDSGELACFGVRRGTRGRKSPEQIQAVAKRLAEGATVKDALLAGGYSENVAKMGRKALSDRVWNQLVVDGKKYGDFAREFKPEERADLVRGKLLENAIRGKDVACNSLKLIGQDKDVGMFQSDTQVGVIVLQVPQSITNSTLPVLDGEVLDDTK